MVQRIRAGSHCHRVRAGARGAGLCAAHASEYGRLDGARRTLAAAFLSTYGSRRGVYQGARPDVSFRAAGAAYRGDDFAHGGHAAGGMRVGAGFATARCGVRGAVFRGGRGHPRGRFSRSGELGGFVEIAGAFRGRKQWLRPFDAGGGGRAHPGHSRRGGRVWHARRSGGRQRHTGGDAGGAAGGGSGAPRRRPVPSGNENVSNAGARGSVRHGLRPRCALCGVGRARSGGAACAAGAGRRTRYRRGTEGRGAAHCPAGRRRRRVCAGPTSPGKYAGGGAGRGICACARRARAPVRL